MWNTLRRWRTWIVNTLAALLLILPDILAALSGFDWGSVVPAKYLPYLTLAVIVLNVWMRPRPAVLPDDEEARR
ncbi:hypothetical protein GOC60_14765 [Sinorhizobium meliloti]|nr:hypothetical protein [Sinorhizobium meliloti]